MLDAPFNLESQGYLLWQCFQAIVGSGSSDRGLKSRLTGEVHLLPLTLGLLHLLLGKGGVK